MGWLISAINDMTNIGELGDASGGNGFASHQWQTQPCADSDCRVHAPDAHPPSIFCAIKDDKYRVSLGIDTF